MEKTYEITILRPAGNDTALVRGIIPKNQRKRINDKIMQQFPAVEQVGFYDGSNTEGILEMAGGEFCGNATRSLAYLLLGGKAGTLVLKVSGVNKLLTAGIKNSNTAFAQMPILSSLNSVKTINKEITLVKMQGIIHLIVQRPPKSMNQDAVKEEGRKLMEKYNLLTPYPAAGVMFLSNKKDKSLAMDPVIWVRNIKTLFYETACASGTTAVGLWLAKTKNTSIKTFSVKQPSRMVISVTVTRSKNQFIDGIIDGPIQILKTFKL